jgi:hypothetical protein
VASFAAHFNMCSPPRRSATFGSLCAAPVSQLPRKSGPEEVCHCCQLNRKTRRDNSRSSSNEEQEDAPITAIGWCRGRFLGFECNRKRHASLGEGRDAAFGR